MDVYARTAHAYDLIQQERGRDYAKEADELAALIRERMPDASSLLDVGCGTGSHVAQFRRHFDVAGVDVSDPMLERARHLLPDVDLRTGDMRSFDFGRHFDVVTCLGTIGYMLTIEEVASAALNMSRHLVEGGLLLIEPWVDPEQWWPGYRLAEVANGDGLAIGRVSVTGRDGKISKFDLYWTVASDDGVDRFVESHELGLYTTEEYRLALESAGLVVGLDPVGPLGRGLFIGVKR